MARRSRVDDPEKLRNQLIQLLVAFENKLKEADLRAQVEALIPANHMLRDLGCSLLPADVNGAAIDRLLAYLVKYHSKLIQGDELMVVAGISEYARRLRELRVQHGWQLASGATLKHMADSEDSFSLSDIGVTDANELKTDTYVLLSPDQDRDAAYRWNTANRIRKKKTSVKNKLLEYFRANVGHNITGEELLYLAGNAKEWARRVRELRTEEGWPSVTRNSGDLAMPVGVYRLEHDRQSAPHDRKIPDPVRVEVLERDGFGCRKCEWNRSSKKPDDPRSFLELHHILEHANMGKNEVGNLITLCNVCHDEVHRSKSSITADMLQALIE